MENEKLIRDFRDSGANINYKAWWRTNLPNHKSYNLFMNQIYGDLKMTDEVKEAIEKYLAE